jgi:hypothetical protein
MLFGARCSLRAQLFSHNNPLCRFAKDAITRSKGPAWMIRKVNIEVWRTQWRRPRWVACKRTWRKLGHY